jgi:hypothetical protein
MGQEDSNMCKKHSWRLDPARGVRTVRCELCGWAGVMRWDGEKFSPVANKHPLPPTRESAPATSRYSLEGHKRHGKRSP